ncbi:sensor histidine kinase [Cohnella fermenti]|nr:histidine kinase [Cohnella fermenti]
MRRFNIYPRLLLYFMIVLLPIVAISYAMNIAGEKRLYNNMSESLASRVHFYLSSYDKEVERVVQLQQQYMFDDDIQNLSSSSIIMSDDERRVAVLDIQKKLQMFKNASLFVEEATFYIPPVGKVISSGSIRYSLSESDWELVPHLYNQTGAIQVWGDKLMIGQAYPLHSYSDQPPNFWFVVTLSREALASSIRQIVSSDNSAAALFDNEGDWTIEDDPGAGPDVAAVRWAELAKEEKEAARYRGEIGGRDTFVVYERSQRSGTTLGLLLPIEEGFGSLSFFRVLFWALTIAAVGLVALFSYWIYQSIHKPVRHLVGAFRKLETGYFNVSLKHRHRDEFEYLYRQFNKMAERLRELIRDVYEQTIRSQKAELKQLQSQINPHFLYNTFYLLNRMVQLGDEDHLKLYTRYLGDYFQYITRNTADSALLSEELRHVTAFVNIQRMRFSHLEAELPELPPACAALVVPRLCLQPIVENAYEHALEDLAESGLLRIGFEREEGRLIVRVENSGEMTDDTLSGMRTKLMAEEGAMEITGMLNVHRRLRLFFGERSGLRLSRSPLGGLRVELLIVMPKEDKPCIDC